MAAHVIEEARRLYPERISFHFGATVEARSFPLSFPSPAHRCVRHILKAMAV